MVRVLSFVFVLLTVSGIRLAHADETDNFTCRSRLIADSLHVLDAIVNTRIELGVARANARWLSGACDEACFTREIQRTIGATHLRWTGIPQAALERWIADRRDVDRCHVKFRESIYGARHYNQPWLFPFTGRIIFIADSIRLDGTMVGLDKISHFIREGLAHWKAVQQGLSIGESMQRELGPARRHFGWTEYGLKGWSLTGVLSYADLAAGYWGFRFWTDVSALDSPDSFVSRDPRSGRFLVRRSFSFAQYVNDAWDESVNCSTFHPELAREVSAALATRRLACPATGASTLASLPDAQLYVNPFTGKSE